MYLAQADVDLRTCEPEKQSRCSYHHVYYYDDAEFLNAQITARYFFNSAQDFKAKVAIVQVNRHLFTHARNKFLCLLIDR